MRIWLLIVLVILAYGFVGAMDCDDFTRMQTVEVGR
jgi:hypothetical protein